MRNAEIHGKHMVLEGFKNIKVTDTEKLLILAKNQAKDCCIQLFDPSLIAGFDHLYFAALNALRAFETGKSISKDLAVEILLYATGQHQISKAIQLLGIKPSSSEVAVLILAETREKALAALNKVSNMLQGDQCDEVFNMVEKKIPKIKAAFKIKDSEIGATMRKSEEQAITGLLIERAALLATQI
jgi:tRNA threonylcarbamoyladenosine modification (KEOPS) complex Cgi121 subunit